MEEVAAACCALDEGATRDGDGDGEREERGEVENKGPGFLSLHTFFSLVFEAVSSFHASRYVCFSFWLWLPRLCLPLDVEKTSRSCNLPRWMRKQRRGARLREAWGAAACSRQGAWPRLDFVFLFE